LLKKLELYREVEKKDFVRIIRSDVKMWLKEWSQRTRNRNHVKRMGQGIERTKPSGLKRLGIDEIAVVKGQKIIVCFSRYRYKNYSRNAQNRTQVELKKYLEPGEKRF
jgi:hypothetical protein